MKRLFIYLALLAYASGVYATIAKVQSASGTTGGALAASFTITLSANPTPGNWIVVPVAIKAQSDLELTVSGATAGNYTVMRLSGIENTTGPVYSKAYFFKAPTGMTTVITLTNAVAGTTFAGCGVAIEYSADRGLYPDITKVASGSNTVPGTGTSVTTNFPNALLIGTIGQRAQETSSQTGWLTSIAGSFASELQNSTSTNGANADIRLAALTQIVSATGTYGTGGISGRNDAWAATLNALYEPTATPTATATATATATFTPTATATSTATATATPSATVNCPVVCPTATFTPSATFTPTATATPSATINCAVSCPTATATPSATFTPSATASATFTPTATPTPIINNVIYGG